MSAVPVESWVEPLARDSFTFDRLLHLSGARQEARICAAGRANVELMIKLCRDGYDHVECVRQSTCACADEGAVILLIAGATAGESLIAVLLRTVRVLRDGGVLAVKLDDIDDDRAVQAALAGAGLEVGSTVFDLAGEALVAHTVRRVHARAQAQAHPARLAIAS